MDPYTDGERVKSFSEAQVGSKMWGWDFNAEVDGYIEAVRLFYSIPQDQTYNGGEEEARYDASLASIPVYIAIWLGDTFDLLWSTTVYLVPGRWNTIQVIPNLLVSDSSNVNYFVGASSVGLVPLRTMPSTNPYASHAVPHYDTVTHGRPDTESVSYSPLLDVKIRPIIE
jgi:hypothetical protein